ncbi:MAG: hypothetical protein FJ263_02595 [Planctomycetes bacterium]|nr:hypothetical protein [Planctomycetota bacterium]
MKDSNMGENQKQQEPFGVLWKHGFLIVILCLLTWNIFLLIRMLKSGYSGEKYGNMVVVLMLLFNHAAFYYTSSGRWSKIMKTIACVWTVVGCIYIFTR